MIHRMISGLCAVLAVVLASGRALAADEEKLIDAHLAGYKNVIVEGSTALTWLLLIFLAIIGLAGLFKNAKRTHLD